MERLRTEVEGMRSTMMEYTEDYEELQAENERLRELLEKAKNGTKKDIYLKSFKITVAADEKANLSG